MNRRISRVSRAGKGSLVVVLPKDWTRGMGLEPGSFVEVVYDEEVRVRPLRNDHEGQDWQGKLFGA